YVARADCYVLMDQYDEGMSDYGKAVALRPDEVYWYMRRGDVAHQFCEFVQAIDDYNEALRLDPTDRIGYLRRGMARKELEQDDAAVEDFLESFRIACQQNDRATATACLEQLRELEPDDICCDLMQADLAFQFGDFEQAIDFY